MVYSHLVLLAVLLYTIFYLGRWVFDQQKISDIVILISAICFTILASIDIYLAYEEQAGVLYPWLIIASEWVFISALAFVLTGLGLAIRESKPKINRAPAILSFIPFLLILVHPLIQDTVVIKELLFGLYSMAALMIGLMLFSLEYWKEKKYGYLLSGTIIILLGFIVQYIPESIYNYAQMTGMMFFVIGIFTIAKHYKKQSIKLRT